MIADSSSITSSPSRRPSWPRNRRGNISYGDRLVYRLMGPTRRSWQLEIVLWCHLCLMIVSNMQGVYRKSFGTKGDVTFLLLAALWLAKHLFLRYIATMDSSTVASPTFMGLLSHITTNHFMGGQIHDRPTPRQIAKFLTLKDDAAPLLQSAQSSGDYAQKLWSRGGAKLYKGLPTWSRDNNNNNNNSNTQVLTTVPKQTLGVVNKPKSRFGRLLARYQQQWDIVRQNFPSAQFLIYCAGLLVIKGLIRHWLMDMYKKETTSTYLYSASLGVSMKQENNMKRKGDYNFTSLADSWWQDAWGAPIIAFVGLTMWIFARVVPPLPEWVAGSHPRKDLRHDKSPPSSTTSARGNNSTGLWSRLVAWGFVSPTVHAWCESQAPVATVPRLHVHTAIFILRMIDIIWVVLLLPRSDNVCQLTGHCTSPWSRAERTYYLYPIGITGPERDGRPNQFFSNQVKDDFSFYILSLNLLISAPMLLWTHYLLSNRTYWASWGLCANEWNLLHSSTVQDVPAWDARRKYKDGDKVIFQKRAFQAVVPEPEGRPYLGFQRFMQQMLAKEVGHPATSSILYRFARIQLFSFICNLLLWYILYLYSIDCAWLFTVVLANGIATYTLSVAGSSRPSSLALLNAEVTSGVAN